MAKELCEFLVQGGAGHCYCNNQCGKIAEGGDTCADIAKSCHVCEDFDTEAGACKFKE